MRKCLFIITVFFLFFANKENLLFAQGNNIVIRERMFIGQVNDVYLNARSYLGKTIKLEGIYLYNEPYRMVVRYGPGGCCGNDGLVGFEVRGRQDQVFPDENSWVEATGVLRLENNRYLYLELISLTVLSKRGNENVRQ